MRYVFKRRVLLAALLTATCQLGVAGEAKLQRIVPNDPSAMKALFQYDLGPLPIVSAHRGGAAKDYPENCLATFERTLASTYSLLEVDPRYTKDGQIVLHHDETLDRTTTGSGPLEDRTLAELKELKLKDLHGNVTDHTMPTLDEAIEWARGKTILVLDQKTVPVEDAIKKIEEHHAESWVMLIVSHPKIARRVHQLNPNVMMEMIIANPKQFAAFEESGVPWANIIAFVGHKADLDHEVMRQLHDKGVCCMAGTSRHLDLELMKLEPAEQGALRPRYEAVLESGVDLIETDTPVEVSKLLYGDFPIPELANEFLKGP